MTRSRALYSGALLVAALHFGCASGDGGRGSSGFDITENFVIGRVLESQECLTDGGVSY